MKTKEERDGVSRRGVLASLVSVCGSLVTGCVGRSSTEEDGLEDSGTKTRNGTDRNVVPHIPEISWEFGTDGEVISSPVVAGSKVYFGSQDGYLYALGGSGSSGPKSKYATYKYDTAGTNAPDAEGPTGETELEWRFSTYGRVGATPAVVDGDVYFGSEDNFFYSVSTEDGEENWRYDTGKRMGIGGSPTVADGVVYFGSGHSGNGDILDLGEKGALHALEAETGDEIWEVVMDGGMQSPPLVYNGLIYHGCQNNSLYARDLKSGGEAWSFDADDVFCGTSPVAKDGVLYSGNLDSSMYALNADDGSLVWEFETGDIIVSSAVATEDAVYFGSYDQNLYAVEPDTGEELWSFDAGGSVFSSPAYRDGIVYFGTESGWLFAVNGQTGEEVWSIEQSADRHDPIKSSPVVAGDMVYFGTDGGEVIGVRNRSVGEDEYEESDTVLTI